MSFKKVATYTALVFGVVGLVALTGFTSVLNESATQLYSSLSPMDDQEVIKAYLNFVAEYGRVQSSHSKHNQKYEVFKANYEKIRRHNERADVPFVMSVNQFTDMTIEEFDKLLGVEIPKVLVEETTGVFVQASQKQEHHHHHHHNKTKTNRLM
jgi:hypothetical protein